MKYKRFLLIRFGPYYPGGGTRDISGSVDTKKEATEWFNKMVSDTDSWDSLEVFDCDTRRLILEHVSRHGF